MTWRQLDAALVYYNEFRREIDEAIEANRPTLDEVRAGYPFIRMFVAEHLTGDGEHWKMQVSGRLGGHLAQWRVPVVGLGVRLGKLTAAERRSALATHD